MKKIMQKWCGFFLFSDHLFKESSYKSSLILFSLGLAGVFFKFFFNAFLARHMSSALYGDFSVAISVFNIVSAYMLFGTASSSLRFFSGYLKKNQLDIASKYLTWNLRIVLVSSFFSLLLLALFTICVLGLHLFHIHDIREYHLVVYFLWLTPIGALSVLFTTYLLCHQKIYLGTFFGLFGFYFFGFVLLIPVIFIFNIKLHSESLWLFMLAVVVVAVLTQFLILYVRMRAMFLDSISRIFSRTAEDMMYEKEWWKVSLRLILNQLVFLIITALDLFLLEIIDPSKEIVGCYAAALTVSGIIWITQQSIFQFISPMIAPLIESGIAGKEKLQALINKGQMANYILNGILILLVVIFTDPILKFFGPEYIVAKIPLWILLGATFVAVISTCAPKLLAFTGNEGCLLYVSAYQIITMIIAGIVLIHLYSATGAAFAALLTWFVRTIGSIYFVRKKLGIKVAILF